MRVRQPKKQGNLLQDRSWPSCAMWQVWLTSDGNPNLETLKPFLLLLVSIERGKSGVGSLLDEISVYL
ncbi:hypothetical protein SLEP1_g41780 [Rubroshorea leprosula]|uniref:Uncharacterized protein n=1 Tax=Rubroshorea leprosula TaxID=152421 RepID=A0AAV5L900_9ROSI|nr:hypothetical protein SLEP1_g41780 [Rubroshorea leprosula]